MFSVPELGVILVIALVVFGPGKLPEVGKSLGKGIKEFKKATSDITSEVEDTKQVVESSVKETPQQPQQPEKKDASANMPKDK